jgi:DNA-binding transcriptional LysR family regulator
MVVVLPRSHPLAQAGEPVSLAALAEETFLLFPRAIGEGLYDAVTSGCQCAGFLPTLGQEAPQIVSIAPLVGAGFGVSIVPRSTTQIPMDEVVCVPIAGNAPKAPISLAWRRHNPVPSCAPFSGGSPGDGTAVAQNTAVKGTGPLSITRCVGTRARRQSDGCPGQRRRRLL